MECLVFFGALLFIGHFFGFIDLNQAGGYPSRGVFAFECGEASECCANTGEDEASNGVKLGLFEVILVLFHGN